MTAPCPECTGRRIPRHPAGGLIFDHDQHCPIREREQSRTFADAELVGRGWEPRPITGTELAMLVVAGVDPDRLPTTTLITFKTPGVLRLSWIYPDTGEPIDLDELDPPDPTPTEDDA